MLRKSYEKFASYRHGNPLNNQTIHGVVHDGRHGSSGRGLMNLRRLPKSATRRDGVKSSNNYVTSSFTDDPLRSLPYNRNKNWQTKKRSRAYIFVPWAKF